jgi:hypothetical protein
MHSLSRRLTTMLLGASLLTVGLVSTGTAQDATGSPAAPQVCDVLTAEEVSAALGQALTVADGGSTDCQFDSDYSSGNFVSLFSYLTSSTLADLKAAGLGDEDVTIGDTVGLYGDAVLYVEPSPGALFALQIVGAPADTVDVKTAMISLAEQALVRLASIPLPTQEAQPTFVARHEDVDLEARFPDTIGGQPVEVQSMGGSSVAEGGSLPAELTALLTAQGKTLDDLSLAFAVAGDGGITAFRIKGVNMTELLPVILPLLLEGQTPVSQDTAQIGGKDVTVIQMTADTPDAQIQRIYTKDDVLWLVQTSEPTLTEVLGALP